MNDKFFCPKCKSQCERDEADVGVGIIYGPWGCGECGWSEDEKYDQTLIEQPKSGHIDQWGGFTPR